MDDYAKTLILLSDGNFDSDQLVQLFELTLSNIEINTIQGMAWQIVRVKVIMGLKILIDIRSLK